MNKEPIDKVQDNQFNESFFVYSFEVVADVILAVFLGIIVNMIADYIGKFFNLPFCAILIVQLILISLVLYIMKIDSKYLYSSWKGQTNYGIIFTSVFLAVQKNMIKFFENMYLENEKKIGIF